MMLMKSETTGLVATYMHARECVVMVMKNEITGDYWENYYHTVNTICCSSCMCIMISMYTNELHIRSKQDIGRRTYCTRCMIV